MAKIINHPLIEHKLTQLRRKTTNTRNFRANINEIAGLLVYEIARDLPLRKIQIETPIQETDANELSKEVVLVPIMRAGLGMVEGIANLITDARVGHIGIFRDEDTLEPCPYYQKLPEGFENAILIVLDPMLATGGSASAALGYLKKGGKPVWQSVLLLKRMKWTES